MAVADRTGDDWNFWLAHFPPTPGHPGDPIHYPRAQTVLMYLRQSAALLVELLRSAGRIESGLDPDASEPPSDSPWSAVPDAASLAAAATWLLRYGQLATTAALLEATTILRQAIDRCFPGTLRAGAAERIALIDAFATATRTHLQRLVDGDRELRRVWQVIDLILAILRGATSCPGARSSGVRRHQRLRLERVAAHQRRIRAVARLGIHARDLRPHVRL